MVGPRRTLAVLGGSSVSTPVLIEALGRAVAGGSLPPMQVRLHGRAGERMQQVVEHGRWRLRAVAGADLVLETHTQFEPALSGADLVLCQVRPGGSAGRAADETLALSENIPGDEGLGPGGLSCYLRSRAVLDRLAEAVARHAPQAPFLHLSSPLGLSVARTRQHFGLDCYGVCELLDHTARVVCAAVEPKLGVGPLRVDYAGLNHQAWLHSFRDAAGRDRSADVLAAIDDPELVQVDPEVIRREAAVPVPYLRLYYHGARELARQRARGSTRGAELGLWTRQLETAYRALDHAAIDGLLAQRRINWYEEGVVPALSAFLGDEPRRIALNLPSQGALPGADPAAIVELPAEVCAGKVRPLEVPPLPPGPAALTARLLRYEAAVLALPEAPRATDLAEVLALHPMVPDAATAERLGLALTSLLFRDAQAAS